MNQVENYTIYSRKPLYIINNDGDIHKVLNVYDDYEHIRVFFDSNEEVYYDYPIEKEITYVPDLGMFFYSSLKVADIFAGSELSEAHRLTILENFLERTKFGRYNLSFGKTKKVKNGVYSVKEFDDMLKDHSLIKNEVYYISDKTFKVKKVEQSDENVNEYIRKFLVNNDITGRHDISKERILFEVYSENNKVYINFFAVYDISNMGGFRYYTRIMNYPIVIGESCAISFAKSLENGEWRSFPLENRKRIKEIQTEKIQRHEIRTAMYKNLASVGFRFGWEHLDDIITISKKYLPKLISKIFAFSIV